MSFLLPRLLSSSGVGAPVVFSPLSLRVARVGGMGLFGDMSSSTAEPRLCGLLRSHPNKSALGVSPELGVSLKQLTEKK